MAGEFKRTAFSKIPKERCSLIDIPARPPIFRHRGVAAPRAPAAPRPASTPAMDAEADRGRFGINSLIHRMSGGAEAQRAEPAPSRERLTEDDRLRDVPAFLRRQAN